MKRAANLALATTYAWTAMVTSYLALVGAYNYVPRVALLREARQDFADAVNFEKGTTNNLTSLAHIGLLSIEPGWLTVDSPNGSRWRARWRPRNLLEETPKFVPGWLAPSSSTIPSRSGGGIPDLKRIYATVWGTSADETNPAVLLSKIEYKIQGQSVSVPGIGEEFRFHYATWLFAVVIIVLLVLIRSEVWRALQDPDLAMDQYFILVDGQRGLERVVALTCLTAIVLAPWLANGCLASVAAAENAVNGGITLFVIGVSRAVGCITLTVVGCWLSLSLLAALVRLRSCRLAK